jgi:hypothetical protein
MEKNTGPSKEAIAGAKRFIEKIKSGEIRRDLEAVNVDGKPYSDKEDFAHFLKFSKSALYKKLLKQ